MTDVLKTPRCRISFPALFKAKSFDGQEPKYSATLLFDDKAQATPEFAALKKAAADAAKEKWGDKIPANLRNPFRQGSEKPNLDGYDGCVFINCSTKQRPGVVGPNVEQLDEGDIGAGDYVRCSLNVYAYDQKGNKGISFGLRNVQKLADGESLGGRSRPEDDFTPVAEGAGKDVDELFN